MDSKGDFIIKRLFEVYISYPEQLPDHTIFSFFRNLNIEAGVQNNIGYNELSTGELRSEIKRLLVYDRSMKVKSTLLRTVSDHISSMTDVYAYKQYENLYGIDRNH